MKEKITSIIAELHYFKCEMHALASYTKDEGTRIRLKEMAESIENFKEMVGCLVLEEQTPLEEMETELVFLKEIKDKLLEEQSQIYPQMASSLASLFTIKNKLQHQLTKQGMV